MKNIKWKMCAYGRHALPINWFAKNKNSPDGRLNTCLKCDKKLKVIWHIQNKTEIDEKRKIWQTENRELHLKHVKKYVSQNREKVLKANRDYYYKIKGEMKWK